MAEIVEDAVWGSPRRSVGRYPWEEWCDGKTRVLTRGEDFSCTVKSMQNAVNVRAFRTAAVIRTRVLDDDRIQIKAEVHG
jgi:hypothetical protein